MPRLPVIMIKVIDSVANSYATDSDRSLMCRLSSSLFAVYLLKYYCAKVCVGGVGTASAVKCVIIIIFFIFTPGSIDPRC